jgi:peptidoglycan/LPS O-acetylase OafA/YrhL
MTRQNNYDALRLIGALTVLVSHQFALAGLPEPKVLGTYNLGYVAVYMFFSISGYLVAGSWQSDPNAKRYLVRRMLRLGPAFMVLMGVSLVAGTLLGTRYFPNNPLPAFNGSLWTIEYEVLCYLVVAIGATLLPMRVGALLAFAALLVYWDMSYQRFGPELGLMFCAGVLLRTLPLGKPLVPIAVALLLALLFRDDPFRFLLALLPLITVLIGNASWPVVRRTGRFGDFSYGLYIYAFPVQQFVVLWLGVDTPYWSLLSVSLVITMVLAVASWKLVEAPALLLKAGLVRDRVGTGVQSPASTLETTPALLRRETADGSAVGKP